MGIFLILCVLGLALPIKASAQQPNQWRRQPTRTNSCKEWIRQQGSPRTNPYRAERPSISDQSLDQLLKLYGLVHERDLHGLWLIDNIADESSFEGHAAEVLLKLTEKPAPSSEMEFEILAVESRSKSLPDNGLFFVVVDKKSRTVLRILLGKGAAEQSAELARYAQSFVGIPLPAGREFRLN